MIREKLQKIVQIPQANDSFTGKWGFFINAIMM